MVVPTPGPRLVTPGVEEKTVGRKQDGLPYQGRESLLFLANILDPVILSGAKDPGS